MRVCRVCAARNEEEAFRCQYCGTVFPYEGPAATEPGPGVSDDFEPNQLGPLLAVGGAGLLFIATVVPFNEFFTLVSFSGPGVTVLGRMVTYWGPIAGLGWASAQYLRRPSPPAMVRGMAVALAGAVGATFLGELMQMAGYGGQIRLGAAFGLFGSTLAVIGTAAPLVERAIRHSSLRK